MPKRKKKTKLTTRKKFMWLRKTNAQLKPQMNWDTTIESFETDSEIQEGKDEYECVQAEIRN